MFLHATHLSRPSEQIKIIRITAIIPTFAIISFVNIYLGTSAVYLAPWMKVCEALSLINFFFLVFGSLFSRLDGYSNQYGAGDKQASTAPDHKAKYPEAPTILAAVTDITQAVGVFCPNSNALQFAHIWITIIHAISAALAIIAVMFFTKRLEHRLPGQRIMAKLIAFKVIILLDFIQGLAFSIAGARFGPTDKFAYVDMIVSIPAILICLEMVIFAFVFHFIYSFTPYVAENRAASAYQGGPFGIFAIGQALNIFDIFREIGEAL
ncbi:hypothetical protein MMC30_007934 [Trapelia coarctata]|nr:hypothetical protein [Trapelia coarctata]